MNIPYDEFPGGNNPLHFAHANGYPPTAYQSMLQKLSRHYHVLAMRARPLWPGASPHDLDDWRPLAGDLSNFLDQRDLHDLIGVGHSMGATTTLRLSLRQPERFKALVLIDPVLFPPWIINQWDIIYRLGLAYQLHPLVRGARRRKISFQSKEAMFNNYRNKTIFKHLDDENLYAYVDAMGCPGSNGSVKLCYKPEWEMRIYVTGVRADMELWKALPNLKPPLLIIRGAKTNTFWKSTANLVQRLQSRATIYSITDATHLVPLERPSKVYETIIDFLSQY